MAVIDLPSRTARVRLVYAGPSAGGKTTNLRAVETIVPPAARGALRSLAAPDGRTLVLDELSLDLGEVAGWRVLADLLSVPGQRDADSPRRAVLAGADAVIFVADSDPARREANRESLDDLHRLLASDAPVVLQANKRDLPSAVSVADLAQDLADGGLAAIPASAIRGDGVLQTLRIACREAVRNL